MAKSVKATPSLPASSRMQMPGTKTPVIKTPKKSVAKSPTSKVMAGAKKKGMTQPKKGMY